MSDQQTLARATGVGEVSVVTAVDVRPSILHYERLEAQSWAPWLRYSRSVLTAHVRAFPEEQFFAYDDAGLVGALSTNRISWNGDPATLGTWDEVAGARQDYQDTHDPAGNTMCLMSMSIAVRSRASGIARRLVHAARTSARDRGLEHLIGDFRPSGYGTFKTRHDSGFLSYIETQDQDGLLVDPWLRAVTRMGMQRLRVDERAMVVDVTTREFERLRRLSTSCWVRTNHARDAVLHQPALRFPVAECELWEAEQTGTWYVHRPAGRATYVESGLWGALTAQREESR